MKQAATLVAEAKKHSEDTLRMNYETWARQIAWCLIDKPKYENWCHDDDKTFTRHRHYFRYLRRIGFKVTLDEMRREFGGYMLFYTVKLDKPNFTDNMY
jgi:hypothetical protein